MRGEKKNIWPSLNTAIFVTWNQIYLPLHPHSTVSMYMTRKMSSKSFWKVKVHRSAVDLPLCSFVFKFALIKSPWTIELEILFLTSGCIQLLKLRPWSNFSGCESFLWLKRKSPENCIVLPYLLMNKDSAALKSSRFKKTKVLSLNSPYWPVKDFFLAMSITLNAADL